MGSNPYIERKDFRLSQVPQSTRCLLICMLPKSPGDLYQLISILATSLLGPWRKTLPSSSEPKEVTS